MINVAELSGEPLDHWAGRANEGDGPFSTSWAIAGPIIERERIEIIPSVNEGDKSWSAWAYQRGPFYFGPTPLVAAMRAFVSSRFGPIVPPPQIIERRNVLRCDAYQVCDQMMCKCGRQWDVNDRDEPTCGRATASQRRP